MVFILFACQLKSLGFAKATAVSQGYGYNVSRFRHGGPVAESLPIEFFSRLVANLRAKITSCASSIDQMSQQLSAALLVVHAMKGQSSSSSQSQRIGPARLVGVIKQQNEVFLAVANNVAEIHRDCDAIRKAYCSHFKLDGGNSSGSGDPFEAADRKEAFDKRRLAQKLKSEMQELHKASNLPQLQLQQQQQQQQQQLQQPPQQLSIGSGFTGGFAAPATTASPFQLGGS